MRQVVVDACIVFIFVLIPLRILVAMLFESIESFKRK